MNLQQLQSKKYFNLYAALLSGVLAASAWFEYFQILLFVAFVPLLAMTENILAEKKEKFGRKLFFYAWLSFLLWNVLATWWLWNAVQWLVFVIFPLKAAFQTLPLLLAAKIRWWSKGKLWFLPLLTAWTAWEYTDLNWILSWSWLTLGNAFAFLPSWVQWYEFTGVLGGSIWILSANYLIYKGLTEKKYFPVYTAISVILPLLVSFLMYFSFEETGKDIEAVVVQPNLDCYEEKFPVNPSTGAPAARYVPTEEQIKRFLTLSEEKVTKNTRFLIFPETSLQEDFNEKDLGNGMLKILTDFLKKQNNLSLITGADTYTFYKPEEATPSAKFSSDGTYAFDYFNAALFINDKGNFDVYHKSKLVIGAENNPFQTAFPTFGPMIFKDLTISLGQDKERKVFKNNEGAAMAPVICYESIFGEFVGEYIQKGATGIAVITNDGWWGDTPGYRQHLAYSSLRAIEMRKDIFRAANTGVSCRINSRGDIVEKLDYGKQGALCLRGKMNEILTFYARFGDYLGRLCAFLIVFYFITSLVRFVKNG